MNNKIYELLKNYAILSHAVGHSVGRVHMLQAFVSTYVSIKNLPAVQAKILELMETIEGVLINLKERVAEIESADPLAYETIHEDYLEQVEDLRKSVAILKQVKRTLH